MALDGGRGRAPAARSVGAASIVLERLLRRHPPAGALATCFEGPAVQACSPIRRWSTTCAKAVGEERSATCSADSASARVAGATPEHPSSRQCEPSVQGPRERRAVAGAPRIASSNLQLGAPTRRPTLETCCSSQWQRIRQTALLDLPTTDRRGRLRRLPWRLSSSPSPRVMAACTAAPPGDSRISRCVHGRPDASATRQPGPQA